MGVFMFVVSVGVMLAAGVPASVAAAATQGDDLTGLTKKIMDASRGQDITPELEQARAVYLRENDYNGLVGYIESLSRKKKDALPQFDYYIALTRYQQLRFLEERQLWDEYFSRGNEYREAIVEKAVRAREGAQQAGSVRLKAQALLWQFHHFQQDAFLEEALAALMREVDAYATSSADAALLKDVADMLNEADERSRAKQVYDAYIRGLASGGLTEPEYLTTAERFYADGNLALAQSMYAMYREKVRSRSQEDPAGAAQALIDVAVRFAYKPDAASDPAYAEEVFAEAAALKPVESWDEQVFYTRAYNLEKAKDFAGARKLYVAYLAAYPQAPAAPVARYKSGLIAAFVLGDMAAAAADFKALSEQERPAHPFAAASLYQMGVLEQWQGNVKSAQALYTKAVSLGTADPDTMALALARLDEIKRGEPLNDNLKTYLDITFGPDRIMYTMQKASLTAEPAAVSLNERLQARSQAMIGSTGCFAVGLEYLWAGTLGEVLPQPQEESFTTSYANPGVKDIKLVVVSPTGIVDKAFDIVDVK
jgi:TolA-binding protein